MNVLIVGYGSIGARHDAILQSMGHTVSLVSGQHIPDRPVYRSIVQALETELFDYVIIANRTHQHADALRSLSESNYQGKLLIEKPLFDRVNAEFQTQQRDPYVAYNLRFHPVLQQLKNALHAKGSELLTANIYVGQYLPDWRPTQDYRRGYSAQREMGGGVLRDLSHELDYAIWLFGEWEQLTALGGKSSSLEIDSDDNFTILCRTAGCDSLTIHMNYLDRMPRRTIVVNTNDGTWIADLIKSTLSFNGEINTYETVRNESYIRMHEAMIAGEPASLCTFQEGMLIMEMIEAIETANVNKKWVTRLE